MNLLPGKTLVEIARVSRQLSDEFVKHARGKTSESFQLEKIVVASGVILEALNGALLHNGNVDERLKDWLSGSEPNMCLDVLSRMEVLLNAKADDGYHRGLKGYFRPPSSLPTQDKSIEAIRLFRKHQSYFHFLLSTEIW